MMMSTRLTLREGRKIFFMIIAIAVIVSFFAVAMRDRVFSIASPSPEPEAAFSSCGKLPSLNETSDFQIARFKTTYFPNGRRLVDPRCGFICYMNDSYEKQSIWCYKYMGPGAEDAPTVIGGN